MEETQSATKYCIKCGKKVQGNADYCPFCGMEQQSITTTSIATPPQNHTTNHNKVSSTYSTNGPYNENAAPNIVVSTKLFFKDIFTINKRLGRADYWWGAAGSLTLLVLGTLLYNFMLGLSPTGGIFMYDSISGQPTNPTIALFILMSIAIIVYIIIILATITAQIRRIHDIGFSGAWWFISLIPIIGGIVLLFFLLSPSKQPASHHG